MNYANERRDNQKRNCREASEFALMLKDTKLARRLKDRSEKVKENCIKKL